MLLCLRMWSQNWKMYFYRIKLFCSRYFSKSWNALHLNAPHFQLKKKKKRCGATHSDFILTTSIWLDFCRRGGSDLQILSLSLPSPQILSFRFTKWIQFECTPQDHLASLPTAANLCANLVPRGTITVSRPGKRREAEERNPELLIPKPDRYFANP